MIHVKMKKKKHFYESKYTFSVYRGYLTLELYDIHFIGVMLNTNTHMNTWCFLLLCLCLTSHQQLRSFGEGATA